MSENTEPTVVSAEPIAVEIVETPKKVPFWKNPRVLKTGAIVATTAAATAIIVRRFSGSSDSEDSFEPADDQSSDTETFVIND